MNAQVIIATHLKTLKEEWFTHGQCRCLYRSAILLLLVLAPFTFWMEDTVAGPGLSKVTHWLPGPLRYSIQRLPISPFNKRCTMCWHCESTWSLKLLMTMNKVTGSTQRKPWNKAVKLGLASLDIEFESPNCEHGRMNNNKGRISQSSLYCHRTID